MRSGRVEEAVALAVKIGDAIKKYTSAELNRVDVLSEPRGMWATVRQLTGRSKSAISVSQNSALTADQLNDYYAAVSSDANYVNRALRALPTTTMR